MDKGKIEKLQRQVDRETVAMYEDAARLFHTRDFSLTKRDDWFVLEFDSSLGYAPSWRYEPKVRFSFAHKRWQTEINGLSFLSAPCPFYELICELRGYTLCGTVSETATVLDAGPWNGISGLYFAARADKGRVLFLEPDLKSAQAVDLEIEANEFRNCKVLRKGLYTKTGNMNFTRKDGGESYLDERGTDGEVKTISLGDLCAQYAPQGFDFLKLDIEGAEMDIAEDLARYLAAHPGSWAAIASYHETPGGQGSTVLNKTFNRWPELVFKTAYPYHETTFACHRDNNAIVSMLKELPDLDQGWRLIQERKTGY